VTLSRVLLTIAGAGGAISNRVFVKPALALSQRISINVATIKPAVALRHLIALRVPALPAVLVTQRATGSPRVATLPALLVRSRAALAIAPEKPALDLVQVKYDLTQTKGANAQAGTGSAWTSPANATGRKNGVNATIAGDALAVRDGTLTLDYADTVGKATSGLAITSATLKFYVSLTTTAVPNEHLILSWGKGNTATQLVDIAASSNDLAAGRSFDITAGIASWADIDSLKTAVRFTSAIASTGSAALDAVELVILATVTDLI